MENKFDVLKRMNDRRGSKGGAVKPANVTFSAVSENDLDEKTSVKTSSDQIEAIKKLADLYYNGNFSKTLQEILDIALGLD